MDEPELQKDYTFAASQYDKEPPKDFSIARAEYVSEILKDFPFATPQYLTELLKACPYASQQDVEKDVLSSGLYSVNDFLSADLESERSFLLSMTHESLDSSIRGINYVRENEERNGREHVEAGPLLHVHSVHVQPKKALKKLELAVYGTIRVCFHINKGSGEAVQLDVYNKSAEDADSISSSGGDLTLGWPYDYMWTNLQESTIAVDLYLKVGDEVVPFAKEDIFVGDTIEGSFEELISKEFHHEVCSATLTYIVMPLAALCKVTVRFSGKGRGRVNVAGKIVARYKNTYGNYNSEPCVLFEKQNDYESVGMYTELSMSRQWLGLPAYSSLELDLDLRDVHTNRKIRRRVEMFNENGTHAGQYADVMDDFAILVHASLFPYPLYGHTVWSEFDEYQTYFVLPELGFELSSPNNGYPWCHDLGRASIPIPLELVEFHSIFIGCKKMGALKIFGTVESSCDDNTHYLFNTNGNDGVEVEGPQKCLPLKDGCMSFDEYGKLELKINLQDVGGKFANRGFATYSLRCAIPCPCLNTQKCFVFPGKDGFCALHYSLLRSAWKANIKIIFKIKRSSHSGVERIYGSAITQYSNFDYSTKFKRDNFQSLLFKRNEKDPVQLKDDGEVPLSRNVVAVPVDSSLLIQVDFRGVSLKDNIFCVQTFKFGHSYFVEETKDYKFEIKLTWSDRFHNGWTELDEDEGCKMGGTNQARTSIKRKQPDWRNEGSDLDEDEDCWMSGVNEMNTSVKKKKPHLLVSTVCQAKAT